VLKASTEACFYLFKRDGFLNLMNFYSIIRDFLFNFRGVLFHVFPRYSATGVLLAGGVVAIIGRSTHTLARPQRSQVEGELVQVHVRRDGADFRPEARDLVRKHARGRDLDGIVPVVVVVAQGVGEVQDSHLGDTRRVLGHVEMGRLDGTLSDGVRHQEEIELAVDNFGLLNEASVDVGTLRRVVNEGLPVVAWRLLEESLAHALVDDDESDLGMLLGRFVSVTSVLHGYDAVQLFQLLVNDLLAH